MPPDHSGIGQASIVAVAMVYIGSWRLMIVVHVLTLSTLAEQDIYVCQCTTDLPKLSVAKDAYIVTTNYFTYTQSRT